MTLTQDDFCWGEDDRGANNQESGGHIHSAILTQ
jgi:hypothetical protein